MPKTAGSPSEGIDHPTNPAFRPSRPICHLLDPSPLTTRRLACTQVEEPALLQRLEAKFPEGHERARVAPRDGAGAPLIKALIVNGKAPYVPPSGLPELCPPSALAEAAVAVGAAMRLESTRADLEHASDDELCTRHPEFIDDCDELREKVEIREAEYRLALLKLKKAAPRLQLCVSELVQGVTADRQNTRRGPCGRGWLPCHPWTLTFDSLG